MDQISNLVIDLTLDAAEFKSEIPRIKNLLNGAASDAERASSRMQRFLASQKKTAEQAAQSASAASSAAATGARSVEQNARAHVQMAQDVEATRQRVEAFNRTLREEQAQARALAETQNRAAAAFYRQIDGVKQLATGLQELQRIQVQIRQAKSTGAISQQDYLALVSDVTAKTRTLRDAEAAATQQKAAFIRRLKEQVTTQKLSSTELLRSRAAQLGISSAADVYIRKMELAAAATHTFSLKSAAARRELGVLFGELARGNFGALRGSSITLANRAGWLESLMTPKGMAVGGVITATATTVYGLGKALYEGQKEGEEFNRQLLLTGNYAGKSASQLQDMARSLSGNGITQHEVAGVLAQVVGSGAFKRSQIEMVTRTAEAMQRATGEAADKTIANFQRLYNAPTKSSEELNRQMHYLTSSQYEYIASLERRGYKEAAGEAAAQAYSRAENARMGKVIQNLGFIERAISSATKFWGQFWDAALNIGRPRTEQMQLDAVNQQIARIYEDRKKSGISNWFEGALQNFLSQKKKLEFVLRSRQGYVDSQNRIKQAENDRTNSLIYQNRILSENLSWQQKRGAALNELWRNVAKAPDKWSQAQRTLAVAQINKDYSPPKTPKTPAYRNNEAARLLLQYSQQQAQVEGQIAAEKSATSATTTRITQAHKDLLSLQQRISDFSGKKLTADEKSVLASRSELMQSLRILDAKEQELQRQTALNELRRKAAQLTSQLAEEERSLQQQQELELATGGMGDKQRQRYQEELRLRQRFQQKQEELARDSRQKGTYGTDEYRQADQTLQDSLNRQLAMQHDHWQQMDAAQTDWKNGARRAFANYTADATNTAGMTEKLFSSAFDSMGNGLADFVTTGKLNFRAFTASLLSDLAKITARMAMMQAVSGLFAGFTSSPASSFPVPSFRPNAAGGVYRSADLSRYSGSVVNRPTFFAFAKGAGVMGEAGPEAILPLRRGADGKLGVVSGVSGRGRVFAPQYHIEINNDGSNGQIGPDALKAVYGVARKAAGDFFQQQSRDGGSLSRR